MCKSDDKNAILEYNQWTQWKSFCVKAGTQSSGSNLKTYPVFAFDPLSLTLFPYIFYCFILLISYMLGIVCVPILVLNQESFIQHLNYYLEESRGDSLEPVTGNSATLLVTHSVLQLVFNSASFVIRLANISIRPPLGIFSIGIRVYAPYIRFNPLGVRSWFANLDLHLHTYYLYTHGLTCPSRV